MSHTKLAPLATCLLIALFATPVFAHEGEDHATAAEAEMHLNATTPLPMKPLDILKARAQQIKNNATNAKIELKGDTKVQLQNAGPGERKDVMKASVDTRMDIAKERRASSTDLKQDFKNLLRMHAGVIKNRFHLAITHMNNLLARIDTRLTKMTADGIDTTTTTRLKVEADVAVDKAEADAQAVADFVANVPDGSERAAVKAELETKLRTAQQSVKAAHESVVKVVRSLVSLAKDTKVKVETSVEVESSMQ